MWVLAKDERVLFANEGVPSARQKEAREEFLQPETSGASIRFL